MNDREHSESERNTIGDLLMVGPNKPLGYLSLATIREEGYDPSTIEKELNDRRLVTFREDEAGEGSTYGGALWVYDKEALSKLLLKSLELLEKHGWPTDPDGFARRVCLEVTDDPELYALVAKAFADPRPEFH